MSPLKRRQVICWPLAPVSCCWETLFAVCTLFTLLVHPDDEPHKALLVGSGPGYPFCLVDKGLNEKHAHAARLFFSAHLAVDVGSGDGGFHPCAIIHHFDFELVWPHG